MTPIDNVRAQRALAVVEAAYSLAGSDSEWLSSVLEAAGSDLSYGHGSYAFTCKIGESAIEIGPAYVERDLNPSFSAFVTELNRTAPQGVFDVLARSAVVCGGFMETAPPAAREHYESVGASTGFPDGFSLIAQDGEGYAIDVSAPSCRALHSPSRVRGIWRRVGVHLAAAMRLRRRIGALTTAREAVLSPSGKIEHAEGDLTVDRRAQASLAAAVRDVERARSAREREDPERALTLWKGLVAGEWSLVDHWEAGGRRYIAAYKNRPDIRDPRALTRNELLVFRYASLGASNKEIAFTVGLSTAAVASALSQLLVKLRCRGRSDLLAFADPARGARIGVDVGGDEIDVLSMPHAARASAMKRLSAAEQAIVHGIVEGETNATIARERGTSPSTVANQVRRIFEKLDVGSRTELARVVTRG